MTGADVLAVALSWAGVVALLWGLHINNTMKGR